MDPTSSSLSLDNTEISETLEAWSQLLRNNLLTVNEVENDEVFGCEVAMDLRRSPLKKPQEARVANLTLKREKDSISVSPRIIGWQLALTDGLFEHQVDTLPCSLDEATLCQRFREATVAGHLL